jgi:hypothetical protein
MLRRLLGQGKQIVLVYPIPEVGWNVPNYVARKALAGELNFTLSTSHGAFKTRNYRVYAGFDQIGDAPDLIRVKPEDVLCAPAAAGRCTAARNGQPFYFDDDHVAGEGALLVARQIASSLATSDAGLKAAAR